MYADAAVNITSWVSGALADSLSRDLDLGLLRGTGKPAAGRDHRPGRGRVRPDAHRGGRCRHRGHRRGRRPANTIALSPHRVRRRDDRHRRQRAADPPGRARPTCSGSASSRCRARPPLLYDARGCFLVLGADSTVTPHDDWEHDATVLLVKARVQRRRAGRGQVDQEAGDQRRRGPHRGQPSRPARRQGHRVGPGLPRAAEAMPTRAPAACADPGCPNTRPCPDHPARTWAGKPMPPGWKATRRRILARDQWRCRQCGATAGAGGPPHHPRRRGRPDPGHPVPPVPPRHHHRAGRAARQASRP